MATLTLAPVPKPSKPGKGPGVAAFLLGFLAFVGPVAALAVFAARLGGDWTPEVVAPWARPLVGCIIRPGAGWWILGWSALLGVIGLLVRRTSMLWLGSFTGLLVTVAFFMLAYKCGAPPRDQAAAIGSILDLMDQR